MGEKSPDSLSPETLDPLPTGTVTFMFTDVEGSTRMWMRDPVRAEAAIIEHEASLRATVASSHGRVVKGMGDGILAVFESARDALSAAIEIQLGLNEHPEGLRARVAIHTGEADISGSDYYGVALNWASRVLGTAHGGQIVLTRATQEVLVPPLPASAELADLGTFRLPDIDQPTQIFQVTHPALRSDFPPLRGLEANKHNLPLSLTSFVGRRGELARATQLLEEGRLLTLSGVGGGGKTRLALRLAEDHVDQFPGGVWIVGLASVSADGLVARTAAQALGVPEEPGRQILESLVGRLQTVPTLLVLDNCEQVVDGSAELVDVLLRNVPDLRILVTSREALGVPGEIVYVVPPMSVPGEMESRSRDEALGFDAVRLFLDRARRADPTFDLSSDNVEAVCRLCRSVDGIPLAIELAAGKVRSMSIEELAGLVTRRLGVLSSSRTGEARHRTMTAMLDWSYDMLPAAEKVAFARLAVFRGTFDLEDTAGVDASEDMADAVFALCEKSLVVVDNSNGRYSLLEPIRQYAWKKLVGLGLDQETSRSHAELFVKLAEKASPELRGRNQGKWLHRLELEHDNLRSALTWSLENGEGDLALRLAAAAGQFWSLHDHLGEGRLWLEQALNASVDPPPRVLEQAYFSSGELAARQGDHDHAKRLLSRALDLAEESDNDLIAAGVLFGLGSLHHRDGDLAEATQMFESAVTRARKGGAETQAGHALASLALLYEDLGNLEDAERCAKEAYGAGLESGDIYLQTDALLALGEIRINRGNTALAREVLTKAKDHAKHLGMLHVEAWAMAYLGKAALLEDDLDEAERLLSKGLATFQELESPSGLAWAMRHLGRVVSRQGDSKRSKALLREGLSIAAARVQPDVPLILQTMAETALQSGHWERAAVLAGAAEALLQNAGVRLPVAELQAAADATAALKARLGEDEFERLAESGASMSPAGFTSY